MNYGTFGSCFDREEALTTACSSKVKTAFASAQSTREAAAEKIPGCCKSRGLVFAVVLVRRVSSPSRTESEGISLSFRCLPNISSDSHKETNPFKCQPAQSDSPVSLFQATELVCSSLIVSPRRPFCTLPSVCNGAPWHFAAKTELEYPAF